jgi:large subunit ribosomal protein L4
VKKKFNKTKNFNKFLTINKLSNALIVSDKDSEKNFARSARNIKNIKVINEKGANIYDMLKYTNVIITSSSMKKIETRLLDEKN